MCMCMYVLLTEHHLETQQDILFNSDNSNVITIFKMLQIACQYEEKRYEIST